MTGSPTLPRLFLFLLLLPSLCRGATTSPSASPQYLVITAPAFNDAIQPLLKHRASPAGGNFQVTCFATTDIVTPHELQQAKAAKLIDKVKSFVSQHADARTYVLLVGAPYADPVDAQAVLPIGTGSVGRMKDQPTDEPYSLPDAQGMPTVAVGRLPARTAAEASGMIAKIMGFERHGDTTPSRRALNLIVGDPGGESFAEKAIGNWFMNSSFQTMTGRIHPLWTVRTLVHIPSSAWYVPNAALHDKSLELLQRGQAFTFYLGHSGPDATWSANAPFLSRDDFASLHVADNAAGIYVTCSCFTCQYDPRARAAQEGYGLAAVRNPAGPVAVIGATAESYSAAGYLALNGLLDDFGRTELPQHLGDAFLHIKAGLHSGPIDFLTFRMFDYGDGSSGNTPLATQRLEHLQMWTLLGDPAMRLPCIAPELALATIDSAATGQTITLNIALPSNVPVNTPITLIVERPANAPPNDKLIPVPASPEDARSRAILANFQAANTPALSTVTITPTASSFTYALQLPSSIPYPRIILRATTANPPALGVTSVKIAPAMGGGDATRPVH